MKTNITAAPMDLFMKAMRFHYPVEIIMAENGAKQTKENTVIINNPMEMVEFAMICKNKFNF